MKTCYIVGAGDFTSRGLAPAEGDLLIAADGGYDWLRQSGLTPDFLLGDLDSLGVLPSLPAKTKLLRYPVEKDDTDTVYAAKEALRRGFDDFLLVGVSGGRLDHTLVNVYLLVMLREQGKRALLVDDYAEMELIGSEPAEISDKYPFYSLVNITGTARGITETGCKFPLDNGEIRCDYQYGTSNEVLPGQTAVVSVKEGNLLLIRDFPE